LRPFRNNRPVRHCFICYSDKTFIDKTGRYHWRSYDSKWYCLKCWNIFQRLVKKGFANDYAIEYLVKHKDQILIMRDKPKQRECYACGASTSYVDKFGLMHWRFNYDTNGRAYHMLCSRCDNRYIENPIRNPITQKRRITFQDKRISLSDNPRTGFCSKCGRVDLQTHLHHEQYDLGNPLAHTVELCCSCHMKRTRELKQIA
jgi:hypothetical protein